ncbi:MAG: MoxR family ATPase, partial [bacterium]|nr:MoxR family ATPase [bacterium]
SLKSLYQGKKRIPLWPLSGDVNDVNGERFFMLLATQNIFGEEEGSFPTPMAELDRYSFSIFMNDPDDPAEEQKIRASNVVGKKIEPVTNLREVLAASDFIYKTVSLSDRADRYITALIRNTRPHRVQGPASAMVKKNVLVGASPRVNFHLEAFARTEAFFAGDSIITIEHVKKVAEMVLAHRLVIQEGMDEKKSHEEICREIIREVLKQTDTGPWS